VIGWEQQASLTPSPTPLPAAKMPPTTLRQLQECNTQMRLEHDTTPHSGHNIPTNLIGIAL
jgi:hypothetical protein